ncbi:hypothetical protein [Sulfitobacter delicatus]|uniref:Inner membrane protein n=1 Tax=Sulfitobacter delicatus TaxID=218672 RepID=A0A1G7J2W0_9RHOB|nr:hypothetical protein [Sulfitobacter delicatus]SDF19215.1 hypothetical protein SAMN04489759_101556 [Sulfitobacter delicatus]
MAKPKKTVTKSEADKSETPSSAAPKVEADKPKDHATTTGSGDAKPSVAAADKPDTSPSGDAAKGNVAKSAAKTSAEAEKGATAEKSSKAESPSKPDTPKPGDTPSPEKGGKSDPVAATSAKATTSTESKGASAGAGNPPLDSSKPVADTKADKSASTSRASSAASNPKGAADKPATSASSSSTSSTTATPEAAPRERKRSVFFPMLLGGAIAAGLGFAAAEYDVMGTRAQSDAELQELLEAQQARIADLEARAAEPAALPESLPQVDALTEELQAARQELAALQEQLSGIDSRLTTVEKQPASGGDNDIAVAAFEREMEALRESVAAQRAEIEGLLENAQSVEEATAEAAEAARAQTAMTRINTALTAGRPYEAPLSELRDAGVEDIPEALNETALAGVVTLANLQARYPDAARAALAEARAAVPDEGEGGFGSFLKRQLGARSVAPREGSDPDAVLSRAEAAVRDGRLTDALAEIDTLPEAAQAAMADWLADARARQAAENAADDLSQRLTAN